MGKAVKNVRIDLKQYFSTLETKSKLSETVRRDGEKQLANSCPPPAPSNYPRSNCGTHFGSSSRLVSKVASDLVTKPLYMLMSKQEG